MSLKEAREKRDEAPARLRQGFDPVEVRKLERLTRANEAATTFKVVAEEYLTRQGGRKRSDATQTKNRWLLEQAYPDLGSWPVASIKAAEVTHRAAITDPKALGGLLRAIDGFVVQPSRSRRRRCGFCRWSSRDRASCAWRAGRKSRSTKRCGASPPSGRRCGASIWCRYRRRRSCASCTSLLARASCCSRRSGRLTGR